MITLELMKETNHIIVVILKNAIFIQKMQRDRILMMTSAVMG